MILQSYKLMKRSLQYLNLQNLLIWHQLLFALAADLEHHISFNALKGLNGIGTMRIQGYISSLTIQISSDNFL